MGKLSHELLARELEELAQTWAAPIRLVADVDATVAQAVVESLDADALAALAERLAPLLVGRLSETA